MGAVLRSGMTDRYMKAIGSMIRPMVTAGLFIQMAMSMRENGKMIRLMVLEKCSIQTGLTTLVIGLMTSSMVTERKCGPVVLGMKASISLVRSMERVIFSGRTKRATLVNSLTIIKRAKAYLNGMMVMAGFIMETGR